MKLARLIQVCVLLVGSAAVAAPTRVFPGARWAEATPESQGVDAKKLEAAELLAATVGSDGVQELVIIRHGRMIWKGDNIDKRHGVWSATKSFTSTVLGLLIADGKCTLDTRVADVLPELKAHYPDVTLRHFTTMTSGYRAVGDETTGSYKHGPSNTPFVPNPKPLFTPPGSQYAYWDSAMNTFGLALTKIAGEPIERLLQTPRRRPHRHEELGLGRLCDRGRRGRQRRLRQRRQAHLHHRARDGAVRSAVPEPGQVERPATRRAKWVAEATRVQVPATMPWAQPESEIDGRGVYGFNWWRNGLKPDGTRKLPAAPEGMFWASGHNNNKCFVIPEWDMVIVRLGLDGKAKDEVWNGFLAKVGASILKP